MIVNNFNLKADFFKANPQLEFVEAFKKVPSKIMWAIALLYDPDSKFFNLNIGERTGIIKKEFLKDNDADLGKYKNAADMFIKMTVTPAKRQLIEWNRIMDEKSEFLKTTTYSATTYEMIEKMLASNTKLYDELKRIQEAIESDELKTIGKGGNKKSMIEDKQFEDEDDNL